MFMKCGGRSRRVCGSAGCLALALALVVGIGTTADAQVTTGHYSGTSLTRPRGAPGRDRYHHEPGTGLTRTVTAEADGTFLVLALPPGQYNINVTLDGFKTYVQEGIGLQVGQNIRIDVPLELGTISEQLVVTAKALQVDTRSSAVGIVVDNKRMEELPLINRSALSLVQLRAGRGDRHAAAGRGEPARRAEHVDRGHSLRPERRDARRCGAVGVARKHRTEPSFTRRAAGVPGADEYLTTRSMAGPPARH